MDTANGVDEGIYVTLGGQAQCLLVCGENTENPVMIKSTGIAALAAQGGVATLAERSDATISVMQFSSASKK